MTTRLRPYRWLLLALVLLLLVAMRPVPTSEPTIEIGSHVLFVLDEGPNTGHIRPAVIVQVWYVDHARSVPGYVDLQVFTDGPNDELANVVWRGEVPEGDGSTPGTWYWPEVAP